MALCFGSMSDPQLSKDMLLQQPHMFIQALLVSSAGVAGIVTNDLTLTPAVSPAWTVDAYKSAVGYNALILGNNDEAWEGPVKGNTATGFTVDVTKLKSVKDGTAGAAADFTATSTYNFKLFTPHATHVFGDFFGYAKEIEVMAEEETAEFLYGIPEESIREDLVKIKWSVKGKNFNIMNEDVFAAVTNAVQKGSQISQWERHFGFSPAARNWFRINMVGTSVDDKDVLIQIWLGQFKMEGGIALSGKEHKGLGFNIMAKKETLLGADQNIGRMRVEE